VSESLNAGGYEVDIRNSYKILDWNMNSNMHYFTVSESLNAGGYEVDIRNSYKILDWNMNS